MMNTTDQLQLTYLTNHFLIAMPGLQDTPFARSVAYVCQHTAEGAMGILINQPSALKMQDVLSQMNIATHFENVANSLIYAGGPVQGDRGFVLHSPQGQWDSSYTISQQIIVTTSRDILSAIADGTGPESAIVALGYAGWGPGQLEEEMRENTWLTIEASPELLFEVPPDQRWEYATRMLGINPLLLSGHAGHA